MKKSERLLSKYSRQALFFLIINFDGIFLFFFCRWHRFKPFRLFTNQRIVNGCKQKRRSRISAKFRTSTPNNVTRFDGTRINVAARHTNDPLVEYTVRRRRYTIDAPPSWRQKTGHSHSNARRYRDHVSGSGKRNGFNLFLLCTHNSKSNDAFAQKPYKCCLRSFAPHRNRYLD